MFVIALALARFINWAIYTWAYFPRQLGPWSPQPVEAGKHREKRKGSTGRKREGTSAPRSWLDHLPVIGWFYLQREEFAHGRWFWLRPMLIELLFPLFVAWYYQRYVTGQTLVLPLAAAGTIAVELNWQFIAHFALFTLMGIATFIDFDEQSIPDMITIPGTIIGIVGAALAPAWLPFDVLPAGVVELHAGVPFGIPSWFDGWQGLAVAVAILVVWGFALLDRRVILRRGFGRAVQYFFARMFRNPWLWKIVFGVTLCLIGFVVACWWLSIARWPLLMSSLLGLAFAGGLTWGVRLSASYGLQVEALGFGDVTLMAMIGTYIGWQPSLLVFFIAPLVAILFVIARTLITGDNATPYGPYLCVAATLLLVFWNAIWLGWAAPMFAIGQLILAIVVACVVLMGVLLWIWRLIKQGLGLASPRG